MDDTKIPTKWQLSVAAYLYSCEFPAPPGIAGSPFSFHTEDVIKYLQSSASWLFKSPAKSCYEITNKVS